MMRAGAAPIAFRPAVPADAPALARIDRAARAAALPGLREPHGEAAVAGWLAGEVFARRTDLVAADAAQGAVPWGYISSSRAGRPEPVVFDRYAAPGRWRQGIGGLLRRQALATAAGRPASLHGFARNTTARACTEAPGFRPAQFRDGHDNEAAEPDSLYRRAADPRPSTRGATQ